MWKYVSRRIRETFERSVNHFEKRSTTNGIINSAGNSSEEKKKRTGPPCRWYAPHMCWNSYNKEHNTNNEKWNFDCLNGTWLGAITWSGAIVVGWYTSQLIHLKLKYGARNKKNCPSLNSLWSSLYPYANCISNNPAQINSASEIQSIITQLSPQVNFISNDNTRVNSASSTSHSGSSNAGDDFEDTLNYIENSLGWAAIQNGQPQDGLKLLRSAANRNHAPALYNLALCYELGIGSAVNEKKAVELYQSAARLKHPSALYNLAIYYAQGRGGLKKDEAIATRLLRLAAVQGHEVAMNTLKSIEEDIPEPPVDTDLDTQNRYPCSLFSDNLAGPPTLSSLFVENVSYLQTPQYNTAQLIA